MKKFILVAFAAVIGLGASAQTRADITAGFYRVQNVGTGRYAYVNDCTGSVGDGTNNTALGTADMGAVVLRDPSDARYSDPATVCYITPVAHKHNVIGQNTSLKEISGHYVQFQTYNKNTGYLITPLLAGTSIYLSDGRKNSPEQYDHGTHEASYVVGTALKGNDFNKNGLPFYSWNLNPVDFTNEYLGITPSITVGGKYYKPYIVGFDMQLGEGMTAYYVSQVREDAVLIKKIEGVVPANTPVIIECAGTTAADNKVTLLNGAGSQFTAPADNKLLGQYFCYEDHGTTAYKKYDAASMRLLAVVGGKLQYITDTENAYTSTLTIYDGGEDGLSDDPSIYVCLKANESYLPASFSGSLPVMTEEEYFDVDSDGDNDLNDLGVIVKHVQGTNEAENKRADINGDGRFSIGDIALYIDFLMNLNK